MKEKPILFSSAMVNAILEGRKTQTRRVVKPSPNEDGISDEVDACPPYPRTWRGSCGSEWKCPYPVGTRLWVRETHYYDSVFEFPKEKPKDFDDLFYYRADGECCQQIPECCCAEIGKPKWRPSIFMPRWASRITLEVTEVRVQRLQEISDDDAKAEGIETVRDEWSGKCGDFDETLTDKQLFQILWDSINRKKHPWASNPWVWCISFSAIKP